MQLRIQSTPALIGINTMNAKVDIRQPQAQVEGENTLPQVRVEMSLPKVRIDQSQAFSESGLKGVKAFGDANTQYAWQQVHDATATNVQQGRALTEIHLGGNPIASQAKYNAFELFNHEFGMVTMPRSRPDIQVEEGTLDIQVIDGKSNKKFIPQKPSFNYTAGKVETYLRQKNSIQINFEEDRFEISL